jgi:hypothetical protein
VAPPLIGPSGTFSRKGRKGSITKLAVGTLLPLAGDGGAQRRMRGYVEGQRRPAEPYFSAFSRSKISSNLTMETLAPHSMPVSTMASRVAMESTLLTER